MQITEHLNLFANDNIEESKPSGNDNVLSISSEHFQNP